MSAKAAADRGELRDPKLRDRELGDGKLRDVVICQPLRTPIGKYGGAFRDTRPTELGEVVLRGILQRSGLPAEAVTDVIFGQCYPSGEEPALGRVVALDAGLPVETAGMQIDRRCGSSLQAICNAAMQVQTGVSEVVIAGGAETMSQVEFYSVAARWEEEDPGPLLDRLARARVTAGGRNHVVRGGMVETAENVARRYGISRRDQDAFAVESQRRAVAARDGGVFAEEIVPVAVSGPDGERRIVTDDEHPRPGTDLAGLAELKPMLGRQLRDATVTPGNACGQSDGAAACILTTPAAAAQYGLRPVARLLGWSAAGVAPELMGIGPLPATSRVLERLGLTLHDIDLIELNEAFAAQVLAVTREWGFARKDHERLNVHGSGISLGHPVGATGARLTTTLLHALERRGGRLGLVTMCIGGGQGMAAVFERIA
ncbi:MAG TPA: acetyl-CoA C-acetyltransferase [Solirubrobacteraceae bacterium]|jgi:acetyl-CoA C-acetyltransferase